jgi:hypothetical protein
MRCQELLIMWYVISRFNCPSKIRTKRKTRQQEVGKVDSYVRNIINELIRELEVSKDMFYASCKNGGF